MKKIIQTIIFRDKSKYTGEWKYDKFVRIRIFDRVLN